MKEYTIEEELRDKEEPSYEELCRWAANFCNGYNNEQEANVIGKELNLYDPRYVSA